MFASTVGEEIRPVVGRETWLFLDMNSFFASVEQQDRPELRGKPVAVAPMLSDATCVIAASYAAKPFGVKTGVNIGAAKRMCPELIVVDARPSLYIDYHRRMIAAIGDVLPNPKTLSVDEIACKLWKNESSPGEAVRLAINLKNHLHDKLGADMHSSVGIAPNVFLAKVAADLQKPNGLTVIRPDGILQALRGLSLRDLPGIGRKMHEKLHAANIHTMSQLYAATEDDLGRVWGGVVGRRWWYMLRGSNDADYSALAEPPPRSVSNSHVLDPVMRTDVGAETVLLRLLGKAATRMRLKGQMARRIHLSVSYQNADRERQSWKDDLGHVDPASDLITWLPVFRSLWSERPRIGTDYTPRKVCVSFTDLIPASDISGSLFARTNHLAKLTEVIDQVNSRYKPGNGRHNTVDLASVYWLNNHAPERIAFRKITDDDRERTPNAA